MYKSFIFSLDPIMSIIQNIKESLDCLAQLKSVF